MIPLTHVCRAWRGAFSSRSSLWTSFQCQDADKTRVYLERSKSSAISLRIDREDVLSPHDPLFQVIPHATSRLKYLCIRTTPENIGHITPHLSHPAPLLECLWIDCGSGPEPRSIPVLATSLFNGNLPSLRSIHLVSVRTELPWRNMINLTWFALWHTPLGGISIGQLLDFFENTPHLKNIELRSATPTSGAQGGRLVSLAHLEWMSIQGDEPCSLLLHHLLIPVGAKLSIWVGSFGPRLEGHLPRSLDNFRNLSDLTKISLDLTESHPNMEFTGPNGQVSVTCRSPQGNLTSPALEYLAKIYTSKTEELIITRGSPPSGDLPRRAFLRMQDLHTLTLYRCRSIHFFIHALHPDTSSLGTVVCPNLEELVLVLRTNGEVFDIKDLINVAAARALCGAKLSIVRIIGGQDKVDLGGVLELREHVFDVESGPGVGDTNSGEEW